MRRYGGFAPADSHRQRMENSFDDAGQSKTSLTANGANKVSKKQNGDIGRY
jgi:hypothetical protein